MALVTTSTSLPVTSLSAYCGTRGVIERENQVQQRRLLEVQSGISITRYRLYHFSKEAVKAGHMENALVRVGSLVPECPKPILPTGHLGRQLDIFYNGDGLRLRDANANDLGASKCTDKLRTENHEGHVQEIEFTTKVLSSAAEAERVTSTVQPIELSLPPILSPTVWRNSAHPTADPAFIPEPEVPLSERPSPGLRFPLLSRTTGGPQVKAGRVPLAAGTIDNGRRRTRARPLCPTSNCRLVSLSWNEKCFTDDPLIDRSTYVSYGQRDNLRENKTATTSTVSTNSCSKRRSVPVRGKCTKSDDFDVVRYRKHWKELAQDKRRFSENDWKRENTAVLMKHISSLL